MRFFHQTNIDFVGKRKQFFTISVIVLLLGIVLTIVSPPKFGIDFTGGTEVGVKFTTEVSSSEVRDAVDEAGFSSAEIKTFGGPKSFLIRVQSSGNTPEELKNALNTAFPDNAHETLKVDKIGPKIGDEMRGQALWAILLSVIAITLYIAFRFEFTFGIGAIVALVHDVTIAFTFIVLFQIISPFGLEIDQSILAGMLTVIGFSINDTVIVFDRIRENRNNYKGRSFVDIVNQSINETLSRTVNTTITAELVLLILLFFGGESLQGFAFTMAIGFLVGTYSSIFIATPFVIWYMSKIKKMDVGKLKVNEVTA